MKLSDITVSQKLHGIVPGAVAEIKAITSQSKDSVSIIYKTAAGHIGEHTLYAFDEKDIRPASDERWWSFTEEPARFQLAAEAYRIRLAHLFDPLMAVHTSTVDPLPHQISAVYESMLPKLPLRYVLADDPGAGKTIMAGLLIRELMVRGDAERCLIIAPGGLVEQWQDELYEKFSLDFEIYDRSMLETAKDGNPFRSRPRIICRIDQLSRNEDLQDFAASLDWDLIICDEAHKMSASYFGNELKKTKRYKLGERLGQSCRHFLLMTATPHNGKEEDFQAFLALLDSDRFYGKYKDGVHTVDTSDLMRRMVKEELLTFEGKPLFPPRVAETVHYHLSDAEVELYDHVTRYVREEMNRAEQGEDGKRRGTVGFALTMLQRRLASSPEAIYQSLKRRLAKLQDMLREGQLTKRASELGSAIEDEDAIDEYSAEEWEDAVDSITSESTNASTVAELEAEIIILEDLLKIAKKVRLSEQDEKWNQLSLLLSNNPEMVDASGNRRKLLIFTEHKDTLNYLYDRISILFGKPDSIEVIHGGVKRTDRRKAVARFTNYSDCTILIATDAAGEGLNMQRAHLMVNYDLPWNPNRLEQRFGRIHRIGQQHVCRLWNMVAHETREGQVYDRLLSKLENAREALGGKVFDVLGEVFQDTSLKDLMIQAIRHGEEPAQREALNQVIDSTMDPSRYEAVLNERAIGCESMAPDRLFKIKEQMDRADAQRLQPYYIQQFFIAAFEALEGSYRQRENNRFEITHVPQVLRMRDRQIGGRVPVLRKYERVCFDKKSTRLRDKPMAELLAPGHPLMDAAVDLIREQGKNSLKQGTTLIDRNGQFEEPQLIFLIEHSIREHSQDETHTTNVSQRVLFVGTNEQGGFYDAGPAPYLDFSPPHAEELPAITAISDSEWLNTDIEKLASDYANQHIAPSHYREIKQRREALATKGLEQVHARLTQQIHHWSYKYESLTQAANAGKQPRMQPENARRRAEELQARLDQRRKQFERMKQVSSQPPLVVGCFLVIPGHLVTPDHKPLTHDQNTASPAAKKEVELAGMKTVMDHQRQLGNTPTDVSHKNLGWDIESRTQDGKLLFLEVKARHHEAKTVTVTKNEMLVGFNKREDKTWFLAIVKTQSGEAVSTPLYIHAPFDNQPAWAETSSNFDIDTLTTRAQDCPC